VILAKFVTVGGHKIYRGRDAAPTNAQRGSLSLNCAPHSEVCYRLWEQLPSRDGLNLLCAYLIGTARASLQMLSPRCAPPQTSELRLF